MPVKIVKFLDKWATNKWIHIAVLFLVVLLCYARTLGSYFLADDFGEIKYVSKIAEGDWHRFWSNFTGNFMQIHTMAVYRPWFLITLVVDYFIWGTNAFGYYLSNVVHYLICVVFIYLLVAGLTDYWGRKRSGAVAFFSSITFALSPLHPESISWVVGRVDIVCLAYFMGSLVALLAYLKKGRTQFLVVAAVSFWIAILTKEMAVGLPILAVAMTFFWGEREKLKKVSVVFILSLILYFVIRYLALGTIGGGYTGSIGANQFSDLLSKWTDTGSLGRVFFPIKLCYGNSLTPLKNLLSFAYFASLVLVCVRLFLLSWPRKWMVFLLLWLGLTLVPIYQLYGLGLDLEGARFLFFATVPLSILVPVILFAPLKKANIQTGLNVLNSRVAVASVMALCLLVAVYGKLAHKNNLSWVRAGAQTRAMGQEIKSLAAKTAPGERVGVVGIPAEYEGAHLILNARTFLFYLEPPFSKDLTDRVCTFGSKYYGEKSSLDLGFFRVAAAKNSDFYKWNWNTKQFEPMAVNTLGPGPCLSNLTFKLLADVNGSLQVLIQPLNVVPAHYDFLDVTLPESQIKELQARKMPLHVSFKSKDVTDQSSVAILEYSSLPGKIRIPVSSYWKWQVGGNIEQISIQLPMHNFHPAKLDLISYVQGAPVLTLCTEQKPVSWSTYGTHWIFKDKSYELIADVSGLCEGKWKTQPITVEFQISKPNYFYNNASATQDSESMVETRIKAKTDSGIAKVQIPAQQLVYDGFRQIRARCLDESGKPIEAYSYPVTLEIINGDCRPSK